MWDEYLYVRSGQWFATLGEEGRPHGADFAPALYPFYMGLFFMVFGVRDSVAIASSATASLATLVAVYLLGRRLYGPQAALAAVGFLAGNLFNVLFARQAITDALFQCLFVFAVYALLVWVDEGRRGWGILGGVALGLCEHTKYHGVFAWLVIALWAAWRGARGLIPWRVASLRLLGAGLIGMAVFSPWLIVIAHHYGPGFFVRHYLGYTLGASGERGTPLHLWTCLSLWCGPLFLALAGAGLVMAVRQWRAGDQVVVPWILLFGLGSFLYMAYPRLLLPMTSGLALLAGRTVGVMVAKVPGRWAVVSLCCLAFLTEGVQAWPRIGPFGSGYRVAGSYLVAEIPAGALAAGTIQPVIWHYYGMELPELSDPAVEERLGGGEPVYFVTDLLLHKKPASRELMERNAGRFRLVRAFDNPVSETDILTTLGPAAFRDYRKDPGADRWVDIRQIRLYRVTQPWDVRNPAQALTGEAYGVRKALQSQTARRTLQR